MDSAVRPFRAVTVFGGATVDRIARSSDRPVMGASNPGTARTAPGGVGCNVAAVLASLGLQVRLMTAVGADPDGELIVAAARNAGVDVDSIVVSPGAATATYTATLDDTGNLIIGVADMVVCDEITPAVVAPATDASHRDFWVVDANLPPATLAFLASEAADARVPLAALTVSPMKALRMRPLLDSFTYLFTNRREASALLGLDPEQTATPVTQLARELTGTRSVKAVVTSGHDPFAAGSRGEVRSFTSLKANVKAVNGAGDSFAAGTIYGLSSGHVLNEAIRFGRAAAVLTLEAGSIGEAVFTADGLAERLATPSRKIAS